MKKLVLLTALTGLAFSVQTMAAGEHRKGKASEHSKVEKAEKAEKRLNRRIEKIDTSGDGKIDLNEYLASSEKRFQSTDLNNDGFITADEMREWGKNVRDEIRQARKEAKQAKKAAEAE